MARSGKPQGSYGHRRLPANAMSVDVEDYFQVSAMEPVIDRAQWDGFRPRVEENVDRILELFARHGATATFFTLGWVAERFPRMIRRIVGAGHEIASHGLRHVRVSDQAPDEFRRDVRTAKRLIEDIAGVPIKGYRAASFSLTAATDWAHGILAEEGHCYSSSIYPIRHDHYGMREAPRSAFRPDPARPFLEIPISTIDVGGMRLPCGGGGYFRLLPYAYSRWAVGRVNAVDRHPAVFYFHPWEIDPGQPRVAGLTLRTRIRHYVNLRRMEPRLDKLLAGGSWRRMDDVFLGPEGE